MIIGQILMNLNERLKYWSEEKQEGLRSTIMGFGGWKKKNWSRFELAIRLVNKWLLWSYWWSPDTDNKAVSL